MPKSKFVQFFSIDKVLLFFILVLAVVVRLYGINTPLADWHSWRQADTASVARIYVDDGIDILHPRFDDLSNIQSGLPNPQGYRFVEVPLYSATMAIAFKYLPVAPLEVWGRIISIIASLSLIMIISYLLDKEEGRTAAISGALVFSLMPFFVYYSRVVLPDMTALALMFGAIFVFYRVVKTTNKKSFWTSVILSAILASLSILIKPTTIFYGLVFVYFFYSRFGITKTIKNTAPYLFGAIVLLPFVAWRLWANKFPEGVPLNTWLLTDVQMMQGRESIFFKPAFFRWVFSERLINLILGGYMIVPFILGILRKQKSGLFFYLIGLSGLAYLFTFQGGNVQHDYYQIMILPVIAIFSGLGIKTILTSKTTFPYPILNIGVVIGLFGAGILFSGYIVKDYYHIQDQVVRMAKVVKTLTPEDALVVSDRVGDTTLLYLAGRRGMPAVTHDLGVLKSQGMQYFITTQSDVAAKVKLEYELVFENNEMFLFKL